MLLTLKGINKGYHTPGGAGRMEVLTGLSLHVDTGESIAVTGPSGSGKTTLINIIGGLERTDAGEVLYEERNLSLMNERELSRFRSREIGFVFQMHYLLPQCTVLENVMLPALPGRSRSELKEVSDRAGTLLTRVGLEQHLHHKPSQLSGGQLQRVALIRALINRPRLILADEPTGSLDHFRAEEMADLLVALNKEEGTALITVTHSGALASRMGKIYNLTDGRLQSV